MKIVPVSDPSFCHYGRIITEIDFTQLISELKKTPIPEDVVYEPSAEKLEALGVMEELTDKVYGELPIQIGYCNGHNEFLNALEYHRDSELNVAATDAILLLGLRQEMEDDFTYDTSLVKAFLVPAGTAVEIYATTLHYAPCGVNGKGFQVAIVLPKGTNYPLKKQHHAVQEGKALCEDALLTAVNKWLIGHAEGNLEEGCFLGLKGKNLCCNKDEIM